MRILIIFLLLISTELSFGQLNYPYKIDEFGDVNAEGLVARLETIGVRLQNDPDSNLNFTMFRAKNDSFGFPHRYIAKVIAYLEKHRGIEPSRITGTFCGAAQEIKLYFYIQSKTAKPDLCIDYDKPNLKRPFLFDSLDDNVESCICCETECFYKEEETASLKAFAELLRRAPKSKAIITFYRGGLSSKTRKSPAAYLQELKENLISNGISPSRIKLINGGRKRGNAYSLTYHLLKFNFMP